MNKNEFIKNLYIVLNEINENKPNISKKEFAYVKEYIHYNKTDEDVIKFKNWLINILKQEILNPNFITALYLPNNLKYYRIQEIYKNLPFLFNNCNLPTYFYSLIVSPNIYYGTLPNFYNACYWFFNEEKQYLITNELMDKINEFTTQNKPLMRGSKDTYEDYQTELLRYKNILKNIYEQDFIDFKKYEQIDANLYQKTIYDYEIKNLYLNKKLGLIGEICAFDLIKNQQNSIFTAKELGNGFGYDMYFQHCNNEQIIENLIEVKTTTNLNNDDYFTLSENEYNTMIDTLNNECTNYYVYRLFADINIHEKFYYSILELQEENILKSTNYKNDNIEYYFDKYEKNNYYFKRKQKINILK